jgi:hypothetical protein
MLDGVMGEMEILTVAVLLKQRRPGFGKGSIGVLNLISNTVEEIQIMYLPGSCT